MAARGHKMTKFSVVQRTWTQSYFLYFYFKCFALSHLHSLSWKNHWDIAPTKPATRLKRNRSPNRKKYEKPKTMHVGYLSYHIRKLASIFLTQTENQMLKDRKLTIRNKNWNGNTEIFWHKNRKTDQKLAKIPTPRPYSYRCLVRKNS